jgi:hypothetical protein
MKVSELKEILKDQEGLIFRLPNGTEVPSHFHVTEVGRVSRHFIDCGGTERKEEKASFQLWVAEDHDHRLAAEKLSRIIKIAEDRLQLPDVEIEIEYQSDTIGKYALAYRDGIFMLESLQTACLAQDNCGIPASKMKRQLSDLGEESKCCTPEGTCC